MFDQMYTISFYEKLGYVRDGEVFIEDGGESTSVRFWDRLMSAISGPPEDDQRYRAQIRINRQCIK